MTRQRVLRVGFTLIEMLTVIGIIAVLLALTAIFFPNFNNQSIVASGADNTAGALLIAKMRAKRDGRPTGLRLTNSNNQCTTLTPIQQPDDYAFGRYVGPAGANSQTATFQGANFQGNANIGDYLEINGGGLLFEISGVSATTLTVADLPQIHPLPTVTADVTPGAGPNYRIIRAPQVLTAEPVINLPVGVIIDLGTTYGTPPQPLTNLNGTLDILFAPSGSLVGVNAGGPVYLLLRQPDGSNTAPYTKDLTSYFATIIAVEPRTGFIAAQPVAPGLDPFQYTRDGQASGM
jgi:prepilin-type N-terminal cleavage/methylation domain-containing protein